MAEYEVAAVRESPRAWKSKFGKEMLSYKILLEGETGEHELNQLATSPAPVPGQKIEGHIEQDEKFGPKLKRANVQSGSGGGGMSPERQRAIQRQHSQEMAIRTIVFMDGKYPGTLELQNSIQFWANFFDSDVAQATVGPQTPAEKPQDATPIRLRRRRRHRSTSR